MQLPAAFDAQLLARPHSPQPNSSEAQQRGTEACGHGQSNASPAAAHHSVMPLEFAALAQCDAQPAAAQHSSTTLELAAMAQRNTLQATVHCSVVPLELAASAQCDAQPATAQGSSNTGACGHSAMQLPAAFDAQLLARPHSPQPNSSEAQQRGTEACGHGQRNASPAAAAHHSVVPLSLQPNNSSAQQRDAGACGYGQRHAPPAAAHHSVVPLSLQLAQQQISAAARRCGLRSWAAQRTTGSGPQQRRAAGARSLSAM
ncbi:hypothetical protein CYMTET_9731 [Cymbomonas tetramitiformis]|uniref:Uncharacterized protein n=1 Tax=Cymbomonas tetramitiformis TaxID=36881 RepID=A0AAE0GQG8_9CHLO|nr:hypothetical protein CYMTET_9731 [Cymbomonas tetramitiformis]